LNHRTNAETFEELIGRAHASSVEYCHLLLPYLQSDQLSESELCDVGFLLRESERWLDDARKEVKAKKELISRILSVKITRRCIEDDSSELRARGELATATPDVKIRPKLPKAGTDEYGQLLTWLGVPAETIGDGLLSVHFKRMSEMLTRMAEEGKQPPPGLVGTYTDSNCVFRRTNNNNNEPR